MKKPGTLEGRLQEQAAKEADRHTTPAREMAARLIAHANAVKARRPVPEYARTAVGEAIVRMVQGRGRDVRAADR